MVTIREATSTEVLAHEPRRENARGSLKTESGSEKEMTHIRPASSWEMPERTPAQKTANTISGILSTLMLIAGITLWAVGASYGMQPMVTAGIVLFSLSVAPLALVCCCISCCLPSILGAAAASSNPSSL